MSTKVNGGEEDSAANSTTVSKTQKAVPDWSGEAKNGDHLWCRTSASGDLCYLPDNMCNKRGHRVKCSACKIIAHFNCIPVLIDKLKVFCKTTFQDSGIRLYRERTGVNHHWIARRCEKGKCQGCGRSFQSKLFGGKETVAMMCSWCKIVYHYKESCFNQEKLTNENCSLGEHATAIVPPTWIVKLPVKETENSKQDFVIKPIPSSSSKPILIFINPKSGGNQGTKLMRTFQWLLNPRQVFDLSEGGPRNGLELYRRVPNLRILACGGDGTVGWILSILDDLKVSPSPPIAVLPLGTGNDLARALGWGGGYTDEPISKILTNTGDGEIVKLDRWSLKVEPNTNADLNNCDEGRKFLQLNVVNNYFSLGVDALIALEFHEAREARPDKFNSRFRNKMFYGQAGGKDLLKRKWKDLSNRVTLVMSVPETTFLRTYSFSFKEHICDGQDITHKIKELKIHALLFLNIPSYGGGTRPWGNPGSPFVPQSTDDGMIEVVGLTTYQLPLLQAGGHGTPIMQCKQAKIVTSCTIPVQVDGEPCRLLPSIIELKLLNTVNMVAKAKRHGKPRKVESIEKISLQIKRLNMVDYETQHHHKESLLGKATFLGTIHISLDTDLSEVRVEVNKLVEDTRESSRGQNRGTSQGESNASKNMTQPSQEKDVKESIQEKDSARKENKPQGTEEKDALPNDEKEKIEPEEEETVVNEEQSRDWWFLDSCTAERFFRIDQAQEHLYYVADVCDTDLYILDPVENLVAADPVTLDEVVLDSDEGSRGSTSSTEPVPGGGDYSHLVEPKEAPSEPPLEELPEAPTEALPEVPTDALSEALPEATAAAPTDALFEATASAPTDALPKATATAPTDALPKALPVPVTQKEVSSDEDLISAAKMGHLETVARLHAAGHDLTEKDHEGRTALHHAAFIGNLEVVQYLAFHGPPELLDMPDDIMYHTALHRAATRRDRLICSVLVCAGCSLHVKDKQGMTANQLAALVGDAELAAYLETMKDPVIV